LKLGFRHDVGTLSYIQPGWVGGADKNDADSYSDEHDTNSHEDQTNDNDSASGEVESSDDDTGGDYSDPSFIPEESGSEDGSEYSEGSSNWEIDSDKSITPDDNAEMDGLEADFSWLNTFSVSVARASE